MYENINGLKSGVNRGVASFTSINIVRLAIEAKLKFENLEDRLDYFFNTLDVSMHNVKEQLLERFRWQQTALTKQFPYVAKQLKKVKEETMAESLKNSSLTIGFIGLAESLTALIGKHHGESEEAQELGIKIVKHMHDKAIQFKNEHQLNFGILATPAEGLSYAFLESDKKKYGIMEGITDKGYYTNSSHVPVAFKIGAFDKIRIEAPYHQYELGGHIGYVEMDGNPEDNISAIDKIVDYALDSNMGYLSINHEDHYCSCGHNFKSKTIKACPKCGSEDFTSLDRITGYLVGTLDKWNKGKLAEQKDRVSHV